MVSINLNYQVTQMLKLNKLKSTPWLIALICGLALAGCDGGSSSATAAPTPTPTPLPTAPLTVGLDNGAVQQWNGSSWTQLNDNSWGQGVTQMLIYNGNLMAGLNKQKFDHNRHKQFNNNFFVWFGRLRQL
jgi:hypothetical protein